jgi:hypothetical protein
MMPPSLLLLGVGGERWFVPVPLFLLWPLLLIAYLVLALGWLCCRNSSWLSGLRLGLEAFRCSRGLKLWVRSKNESFRVRLV